MATVFIYRQLTNNRNLRDFRELIHQLSIREVKAVLAVIFLMMLLNWFLEALKWKFLVKNIERITIWKSVESVFCGLTWAVFTPNRIGEYGGRIMFLRSRKRVFGAIAMGVGAVGQMVITNVIGAWAMFWFLAKFMHLDISLLYGVGFLAAVFSGFFILFFFNIRWVDSLIGGISFLKPLRKFFSILAKYRLKDLFKVFGYSAARFVVFTFQYYLIIHLLIPEINGFEMCGMIFILFFIQSALPSLDLLDVGVRGMTATYFFGYITNQHVAVMAATSCIWFVNLILPAVLGSVFVFKLNFFGNNNQ
ncbi:hypothetical protein GS399_08765 [Pedobacter sp. HMF7647]|uniref:Flippase-like domain-containing protein n=2 Tax=Hufsiella arboris TaxID=2695275 RepID=A0A7K1YA99_9SPHI|nr:hypothetical protein [Hufsiella arboris]